MTKFTVVFLSSLLTLASQAYAGSIVCSNGDADVVGDAYYQIELMEDGIQFRPYEGSFDVDAGELKFENGVITIVNKTVTQTTEGVESSVTVDAILTMNEDGTQLDAIISIDQAPAQAYKMSCEKQ
ncbi:MAG: hypothetical protein H6623_02830 [Bdellovibrionaceae bacterium]|nr:hypothetical protein [Pseudobdellovibrionaceae bacterium]